MENKATKETQDISPSMAILAVATSFLLMLFSGVFIIGLFGEELGERIFMVLGELLIAAVPFGYMIYKRFDIKKYIGLEINLKTLALGVAVGALLLLFDIFISNILVALFGPSEAIEQSNKQVVAMSSSIDGLFLIIASLTLAGICEEFTFRGFLQNAIRHKYSSGVATLASSLAFGFVHFDPQMIWTISAFLLGLFLGYVYHRWHSYIISATAHATLNLIVLALALLIP
ncbi:MAG: type II CAAX prenyl endopeptidase Rce1 family protein [Candidatus Bathyarchaeales archaeon]